MALRSHRPPPSTMRSARDAPTGTAQGSRRRGRPTSSNRIALFPGPSEVALCRAARRAGRDRARGRVFGAGAPRPVRRACGAHRRGRGGRPYVPALALPEVPAAEPGHGVALPGTRGPRGPARPAGASPSGRTRHGGRTARGLRRRHPAGAVARSTPMRRRSQHQAAGTSPRATWIATPARRRRCERTARMSSARGLPHGPGIRIRHSELSAVLDASTWKPSVAFT